MNNIDTTQLPVIVLAGLEGNDPTQLGSLQQNLLPHTDMLLGLWALAFCITISVVVIRGVIKPLFFTRS